MKKLITLLFIGFIAVSAKSQTVEEIIAKHITAIGGKEKILAIKNMRTTTKSKFGTFEIPSVSLQCNDGSMHNETKFQGLSILQAYDAKTKIGWSVNPMQGDKKAQKMNEDDIKDMQEGNVISEFVDYKERGATVEYLGKEDFEGDEVYKIMYTKKSGNIVYYFIDTQTNLILKTTAKIKNGEREFEAETNYSNYETVDGIILAKTTEFMNNGKLGGQVNIEKVEFNVTVDESILKMPEEKK